MYSFFRKNIFIFALGFSFCLYILSLFIVRLDLSFKHRWLVLFVYLFSLFFAILPFFKTNNFKLLKKFFTKKELLNFGFVLILVEFVSFYLLRDYPFVSVGDGLRDSGLDAVRITSGEIKSFFDYGNYNGYGRIIPLLASFFYRFFGNSVLTYRVPAAIISCLDVFLIYILLTLVTKKRLVSFVGSLVLVVLPLHIFLPRIELVLIFDSFWTSLLLLLFYLLIKKKKLANYILFALFSGIACQFHTPARILALLLLSIVLILEVKSLILKFSKRNLMGKTKNLFFILVFCFVGFGPTVLYSDSTNFLQRERFVHTSEINNGNYFENIETIKNNYIKSLMVLFYEPTTSRYPDHKPILSPAFALLLVIGLGYCLFVLKDIFYNSLIFLLLILPFTNSAMTDWVNADHRLVPLLPIAAIFISLGSYWLVSNFRRKNLRRVVFGLITLYSLSQVYFFFSKLPADKGNDVKDYLSMHIIYFLQSDNSFAINYNKPSKQEICLYLSEENYQNLNLLHYQEQYNYFLPDFSIARKEADFVEDNEVYIFKGACPEKFYLLSSKKEINCSKNNTLFCPLNFKGSMIIYY